MKKLTHKEFDDRVEVAMNKGRNGQGMPRLAQRMQALGMQMQQANPSGAKNAK